MSQALTTPSERTQTILRWVVCFAVVLLAHVVAVAKLLEHSDFADAPPGSEAVELDLALGDPQEQIDPIQYTPPKPVEQEVKPQQEPEQKGSRGGAAEGGSARNAYTGRGDTATGRTGGEGASKVSAEVVRKWQMTVNTRLNQYKRYPTQARTRHHEGRVVVAFTLDTDGHVVNSKIVTSSGSALLDQETLDLLARAQPFPVPPNGAGGQDLFLQVPIAYGLR